MFPYLLAAFGSQMPSGLLRLLTCHPYVMQGSCSRPLSDFCWIGQVKSCSCHPACHPTNSDRSIFLARKLHLSLLHISYRSTYPTKILIFHTLSPSSALPSVIEKKRKHILFHGDRKHTARRTPLLQFALSRKIISCSQRQG